MVQRGLTFSHAADTYTRLTVGDGLVTQIPGLSKHLLASHPPFMGFNEKAPIDIGAGTY